MGPLATDGGYMPVLRIEKSNGPVNSIIKVMGIIIFFLNMSIMAVNCWTPWSFPGIMDEVQFSSVFGFLSDGATAGGGMERFWDSNPEWLVLWIAVLAILTAVAWYVIGKIRPKTIQKELTASNWLSKYRDLHSQGGLSDEEFRTIKTTLATQLQDELKDNGEKG